MTAPAAAQQAQPSSQPATASPQKDEQAKNQESLKLPVSLDKIREGLEQPPGEPLKLRGLDERAQFRVEINERQKIDELLQSLKFNSGPAVPGGLYGWEQQQVLFPKVNNPLAQPYAAFSQGELLTVAITTLIEKYVARRVMGALIDGARARAEEAAREEVQRAIAEFWAWQGKTPPTTTPK